MVTPKKDPRSKSPKTPRCPVHIQRQMFATPLNARVVLWVCPNEDCDKKFFEER